MTKTEKTEISRIANVIRTQDILRRHDFNFKKKFGQNFLTDHNILTKITATAELSDAVNVIEIGPGIGSLTQYLLEEAAEVMAFEIDKTLIPILDETLAEYDNFILVNTDILKVDLAAEIAKFKNPNLPIKVVANLPYYITTPILMHLIESKIPFAEFVVMMQKEVADRIAANPKTKAYGSLSIAVQYYMEAQVAFIVPRTVFIPAPNVDSAILKMTRREKPLVEVEDETWFFKIMHAGFVHRRKTLLNNMQAEFGKDAKSEIEKCLTQAEISPSVRAEALSIPEFAHLADALMPLKK
ncbi:16S rRNA (adenine(1518)-N(6)/adenine(1519)-N(6))-dimethyltransferase RsmA [Lactococcus sp.]|uniref:16S rRNA (adenine(1518)-N(6)/adenine(1519)-N(6))- dimethyltransferase RsmA n=1 Tax=Lactococcus sp. TaxID=44273 RepID=UPI0035B4A017